MGTPSPHPRQTSLLVGRIRLTSFLTGDPILRGTRLDRTDRRHGMESSRPRRRPRAPRRVRSVGCGPVGRRRFIVALETRVVSLRRHSDPVPTPPTLPTSYHGPLIMDYHR